MFNKQLTFAKKTDINSGNISPNLFANQIKYTSRLITENLKCYGAFNVNVATVYIIATFIRCL